MTTINKLLEQKKALEARIRCAQKREHERQRERIFILAAEAGISHLPDEVLKVAFLRLAAVQKSESAGGEQ